MPNFAAYRDTNIDDPNISTVVSIGVMGSGKSTLANVLALRDDQAWIPAEHEEQLFPTGSGESACTKEAKVIMTASNYISAGRRLRIIDPPGLNQTAEKDQEHLKNVVRKIKETSKYLKLFMIVFNC
jgi:predicted GTPase